MSYRVLHITPDFLMGGAQQMIFHMLTGEKSSNYDASALSLLGPFQSEIEQFLFDKEATVSFIGKRPGLDLSIFKKISQFIDEFKPDIVHTHRYALRYAALGVYRFPRIAWVHTVHNVADKEVDKITRKMYSHLFRRRVNPVAISEQIKLSMVELYGDRDISVIPNGVPVMEFRGREHEGFEWRLREGYSLDDVLLISIGRLHRQKNHEMLINAFASIVDKYTNIHLLIVGDGTLRTDLEAQAQRLGIGKRVRFLGIRTDIPVLLAASDVFVMSSDWEGNPLSVMEAMSSAKPVISTSVGGVPELVGEDTGILVTAGDKEGFGEAMLALSQDPDLRRKMGKSAREKALRDFDVSQMCVRYETLYEKLLSQSRV